MDLCLQPVEPLPEADVVVLHLVLIQASEQTYLYQANQFAPGTLPTRSTSGSEWEASPSASARPARRALAPFGWVPEASSGVSSAQQPPDALRMSAWRAERERSHL
jgi:hypothetical protein